MAPAIALRDWPDILAGGGLIGSCDGGTGKRSPHRNRWHR